MDTRLVNLRRFQSTNLALWQDTTASEDVTLAASLLDSVPAMAHPQLPSPSWLLSSGYWLCSLHVTKDGTHAEWSGTVWAQKQAELPGVLFHLLPKHRQIPSWRSTIHNNSRPKKFSNRDAQLSNLPFPEPALPLPQHNNYRHQVILCRAHFGKFRLEYFC